MLIDWEIFLMPVIGGSIGWLTNVVAIKMLFWPKRPIKIPGVSWQILGLLPKRKADLAFSVGQAIDQDLLPFDEVMKKVKDAGYQEHLITIIIQHIDMRFQDILPRILPENIKVMLRDYLKDIVAKEANYLINEVTSSMFDKMKDELKIGELIEERIISLNLDELENVVVKLAKKELRHIELLGALLGLLIGFLQALIVIWRIA